MPRGFLPLEVSPAPRRFAQALGGGLAFAIGLAMVAGATTAAWIPEGVFAAGVSSAVVRRFCLPAHLY